MARPPALWIAVVLLAGCRNGNPPGPVDPFFGRTRIEAPATGAVTCPTVAPPYSPAAPQMTLPPGMGPVPGANVVKHPTESFASSQSGRPITIPAEARKTPEKRDVITRLAAKDIKTSEGPAKVPEPASVSPARVYQTLGPRPKDLADAPRGRAASGTSTNASQSRESPTMAGRAVDIMDLPAAGTTQPRAQTGGADVIRLVSAEEEIQDASAAPSASAAPAATPAASHQALYGYDPQYRWLRGRLEYSEANHHWKLRYIPIDGVTDDFGGSVILSNTAALSGYERGDSVEVHGTLKSANSEKRDYSPQFEVRQIKRVRN